MSHLSFARAAALACAMGLAAGPGERAARAADVKMETCVTLKETKIQGSVCKGMIANGCDHEVVLTVHYDLSLRKVVILPVTAEGPAYEYRDGGTTRAEEKGTLQAGESRWFIHAVDSKGPQPPPESQDDDEEGTGRTRIEVARCNMGFSYTYQK